MVKLFREKKNKYSYKSILIKNIFSINIIFVSLLLIFGIIYYTYLAIFVEILCIFILFIVLRIIECKIYIVSLETSDNKLFVCYYNRKKYIETYFDINKLTIEIFNGYFTKKEIVFYEKTKCY